MCHPLRLWIGSSKLSQWSQKLPEINSRFDESVYYLTWTNKWAHLAPQEAYIDRLSRNHGDWDWCSWRGGSKRTRTIDASRAAAASVVIAVDIDCPAASCGTTTGRCWWHAHRQTTVTSWYCEGTFCWVHGRYQLLLKHSQGHLSASRPAIASWELEEIGQKALWWWKYDKGGCRKCQACQWFPSFRLWWECQE